MRAIAFAHRKSVMRHCPATTDASPFADIGLDHTQPLRLFGEAGAPQIFAAGKRTGKDGGALTPFVCGTVGLERLFNPIQPERRKQRRHT